MTKQEMIDKAREAGMDGFYYPGECACFLNDNMPCGEFDSSMDDFDCEMGVRVDFKADEDCTMGKGFCEGKFTDHWHICSPEYAAKIEEQRREEDDDD